MSLWSPGTLEGVTFANAKDRLGMADVTPAALENVLRRAVDDHTPQVDDNDPEFAEDREKYAANIPWEEIPINEWDTSVSGDRFFDDLCAAAAINYRFRFNMEWWTITTAVGGMRIVSEVNPEITKTVHNLGEKMMTEVIRAQGFVNPDPYIGLIEVTYSTRGYRAGYGIRKSGKCSIWYD